MILQWLQTRICALLSWFKVAVISFNHKRCWCCN